MRLLIFVVLTGILVFAALPTYAHEAYVLDRAEFEQAMGDTGVSLFQSLDQPQNIRLFFLVAGSILVGLFLSLRIRRSSWGMNIVAWLEARREWGLVLLRVALGLSFILSAADMAVFGPEIVLDGLPQSALLRGILYVSGFLLMLGFLTEVGASGALFVFAVAAGVHHWYILNYSVYIGAAFIFLMGSRVVSLDGRLRGPEGLFSSWRPYRPVIMRLCFGFSLAYTAITVKFLHPSLPVMVVEKYDLTRFWYLFPGDPLFVAFGAALVELMIGLFIIAGFEVRLASLVSLFYMTLSLMYFQELFWPHLILFAALVFLLLEPEKATVEGLVSPVPT